MSDLQCSMDRQKAGLPYPKTCPKCGLGPCKKDGYRPFDPDEHIRAIVREELVKAGLVIVCDPAD